MSGGTHGGEDQEPDEDPTLCCKALTAECLACAAGVTPYEYCQREPETLGCRVYPPPSPPPPPPPPRPRPLPIDRPTPLDRTDPVALCSSPCSKAVSDDGALTSAMTVCITHVQRACATFPEAYSFCKRFREVATSSMLQSTASAMDFGQAKLRPQAIIDDAGFPSLLEEATAWFHHNCPRGWEDVDDHKPNKPSVCKGPALADFLSGFELKEHLLQHVDIDKDGKISAADLAAIQEGIPGDLGGGHYGNSIIGDFDGDGVVGPCELLYLRGLQGPYELQSLYPKECAVDELAFPRGKHRCSTDDDCQGPRTCSRYNWCQGSAEAACCTHPGRECHGRDD